MPPLHGFYYKHLHHSHLSFSVTFDEQRIPGFPEMNSSASRPHESRVLSFCIPSMFSLFVSLSSRFAHFIVIRWAEVRNYLDTLAFPIFRFWSHRESRRIKKSIPPRSDLCTNKNWENMINYLKGTNFRVY